MDKRIFFLLICLLIWIFIGWYFFDWAHKGTSATASHKSSLELVDGDNMIAKSEAAHFDFLHSGAEYETPIDGDVTAVIDKAVTYLNANPAKALQITGWYTDKENNGNTTMDNLGLARASHVKRLFSNKGISDNQLAIDGKEENDMRFIDGKLLKGPITFNLIEKPNTGTAFETLKAKFQGTPIVVQFDTANDHPSLSPEQRKDIGDLIYYIKNNPNSSIDISGHSDNRGGRNANIDKSKERAEFIKNYLVDNGLVAARANVIGVGPDKPIATNGTSSGRAQNRRVEITLN